MEIKQKILLTLIIGLVLVIGFYAITNAITKYTGFFVSQNSGPKSDFKTCLEEQDITLYINTADSAETLKNIQIIDYLENIKIINCLRSDICQENKISSFPLWVINGNKVSRDITLEELKQFSGCR